MVALVYASYLVDASLLALMWLAGGVGWQPALAVWAGGTAQCAVFYLAFRRGWNERAREPYLALPQAVVATAVLLGVALWWPEVALLMVLSMFLIFAFAALRLSTVPLLLMWLLVSAGVVAVVIQAPSRLSLPHGTPAQALLTALWMAIAMGRCAVLGQYGAAVRRRLGERTRQLADATDRLQDLATRDELTGALNRRAVMQLLAEACSSSGEAGQGPAVILADLDHFKRVNDTHGHLVGDQVLRRFAIICAGSLRSTDRLGRYGGEEFLVVLPAVADGHTARAVAERVRESLGNTGWDDLVPGLRVSVSLGVATWVPGEPVEALLQRADEALYQAKAGGRDRVVLAAAATPPGDAWACGR